MKKLFILILFPFLLSMSCGSGTPFTQESPQPRQEKDNHSDRWEARDPKDLPWSHLLPRYTDPKAVVAHKAYTLEYSEEHEQPLWVAYLLTREYVNGTQPRTNDFREDTDIATVSAQLEDYRRSGYSRGHLCPAGDMKWDYQAMSESFLMSNMSPQTSAFNDGVWKRMEEQTRRWAQYYDSLYVVTGPVLQPGLTTIGENKVSVPDYYYKIVYDPRRQEAICFLVAQDDAKGKILEDYITTIDEVESCTGLDFFPQLPDEIETKIESQCDKKKWKWGRER